MACDNIWKQVSVIRGRKKITEREMHSKHIENANKAREKLSWKALGVLKGQTSKPFHEAETARGFFVWFFPLTTFDCLLPKKRMLASQLRWLNWRKSGKHTSSCSSRSTECTWCFCLWHPQIHTQGAQGLSTSSTPGIKKEERRGWVSIGLLGQIKSTCMGPLQRQQPNSALLGCLCVLQ